MWLRIVKETQIERDIYRLSLKRRENRNLFKMKKVTFCSRRAKM